MFPTLRPLLAVLLFVAPALRAPAAAPLSRAKADALRERFETRQRETQSWMARFTQTYALPGLRAPVVSEGTIRFKAPDAMRIDFTQPADEWVLAVGDRLFIQKTGKRVSEKSLHGDQAGKPFVALMGLIAGKPAEGEDAFEIEVTEDGDNYVIVLTKKPNAEGRLPKRITNVVAASSLNVREVLVELPRGGSLSYAFRDPVRNRSLDASLFAPPPAR